MIADGDMSTVLFLAPYTELNNASDVECDISHTILLKGSQNRFMRVLLEAFWTSNKCF